MSFFRKKGNLTPLFIVNSRKNNKKKVKNLHKNLIQFIVFDFAHVGELVFVVGIAAVKIGLLEYAFKLILVVFIIGGHHSDQLIIRWKKKQEINVCRQKYIKHQKKEWNRRKYLFSVLKMCSNSICAVCPGGRRWCERSESPSPWFGVSTKRLCAK